MAVKHAKMSNDEMLAWCMEFFRTNPGASTHACLKAMNNHKPRLTPVPWIVTAASQKVAALRIQAMTTHPAKPDVPSGPRLVSPAWTDEPEPEESIPTRAPQETPMPDPNVTIPSEQEMLKTALRALQAAMRTHKLSSVTITALDDEKFTSEVKVTRKPPSETYNFDL